MFCFGRKRKNNNLSQPDEGNGRVNYENLSVLLQKEHEWLCKNLQKNYQLIQQLKKSQEELKTLTEKHE